MSDLAAQLAAVTAELAQARARLAELDPIWTPLYRLEVEIPLVSEANQREHHHARAKRARQQRDAMTAALMRQVAPDGRGLLRQHRRLLVVFTRLAARRLDDDNATGGAKHVRDAVAAWLGVDDGARGPVTWHVEQETHKRYRLRPGVRVEILGAPLCR